MAGEPLGWAGLQRTLRPSGALLDAQVALGSAIESLAVARTGHDPTTLDLLIRLRLARHSELRGVELCRQLHKSPSHVSRMIDRAEQRGLVRRKADPNDRRAQLTALTEVGGEVVDGFIPHLVEVLDRTIYSALTRQEIEALTELLQRITRSAHELLRQHQVSDPDSE